MSSPITIRSWPRAIAHIDADAFFASVEQSIDPKLKGKPIATGAERGIIAAASYEAKAKGVKRGVSISEAKTLCPECIFLPSDYETYSIYSKRMFSIIRRFTPTVEEYSIDEAFCDLTGLRRLYHTDYRGIAVKIQHAIECELGITASIGVSLSKSLAKLCSKFRKPNGLTAVSGRKIHLLLERTKLEDVWGFGPNTVALLEKHGLQDALKFVERPNTFASGILGKVGREIWMELRGECVNRVSDGVYSKQISISKAKTFTPPSLDKKIVWARALRNLESACIKARRHSLAPRRLVLLLKGQDFSMRGDERKVSVPTASTGDLVPVLKDIFNGIYRVKTLYRATNVVLYDLVDQKPSQFELFSDPKKLIRNEKLFAAVDEAASKYGKHVVSFADCTALNDQHSGKRGRKSWRRKNRIKGESERKYIGIPFLK